MFDGNKYTYNHPARPTNIYKYFIKVNTNILCIIKEGKKGGKINTNK